MSGPVEPGRHRRCQRLVPDLAERPELDRGPSEDRTAGWNFLVPGHAFYKRQLAGIAEHPTPDAAFSGAARVVRIDFDAGPGAPAGELMRRNGLATYRVGLFSNILAYSGAIPGVPAEPSGVARIRGCEENKTVGTATWPGQPASNCDPAVNDGWVYATTAGESIDVPATAKVYELSWVVGCPTGDCDGGGPAYPSRALLSLAGLRVTVRDDEGPDVALDRTGLLESGLLSGVQNVGFAASDLMGLDRADVLVDGNVAGSLDWPCGNSDGGAGPGRLPCTDRQRSGQAIAIDTRALSNGVHAVALRVMDALGNATVSAPMSVTVLNFDLRDPYVERRVLGLHRTGEATEIVPSTTTGATSICRARHHRRMCHAVHPTQRSERGNLHIRRWHTAVVHRQPPRVSAVLRTTDGERVAAARLSVFESQLDGTWRELASRTTRSDGSMSMPLAAGPSRQVKLVFAGDETRRGSVGEAVLPVAAHSSMRVVPARVRNRRSVTFSGRITTGPVPSRGKLLLLQVVLRGHWRTFRQLRSGADGRWSARYRFTETTASTRYRFRVVVPAEAGYPYSTARGPTISVRVRP